MHNLLTDVASITVGHATDLALGSGVTAVLFDQPAVAAVSMLGGVPGERQVAMLEDGMTLDSVDAIVLAGGSSFGLDAAGGVQAALRERGRGLALGTVRVPIVSEAIIFDLANGGNKDWGRFAPYRELGYEAAAAAADTFTLGSVGGGTGATTAIVKGGLGSASARTAAGHIVAALVVVNAVGSPLIGDGPWFWAAPYEQSGEFGGRGWPARIDPSLRLKGIASGTSTTIGLVATDASLTKGQAKRLAIMAHDGLARAVLPAHAPLDGDTIFAAATGMRALADPARELTELGYTAALCMARAIGRGIYEATALPVQSGQRSWRELFA
jgi:L-aminopeptidase/D-esterase-like protein